MAAYRISLQSCVENTGELRVTLQDDEERDVGRLDALSGEHARMVARDMIALVRQRDPRGEFILDTYVERRPAA